MHVPGEGVALGAQELDRDVKGNDGAALNLRNRVGKEWERVYRRGEEELIMACPRCNDTPHSKVWA